MKHFKTFENFTETFESNRWWDMVLKLDKVGAKVEWLNKIGNVPGVISKAKEIFPSVRKEDLAIVFKSSVPEKWEEVKTILNGVKGEDKEAGEFILINSKTA